MFRSTQGATTRSGRAFCASELSALSGIIPSVEMYGRSPRANNQSIVLRERPIKFPQVIVLSAFALINRCSISS